MVFNYYFSDFFRYTKLIIFVVYLAGGSGVSTLSVQNEYFSSRKRSKYSFNIKRAIRKSSRKQSKLLTWQRAHIMFTFVAVCTIIYLVYRSFFQHAEPPIIEEIQANPWLEKPSSTKYDLLPHVSRLAATHQGPDSHCHNKIFEQWTHKYPKIYEYYFDSHDFRRESHIARGNWQCDVCNEWIPVCYYAKGIAAWHCTHFEKHSHRGGFHVCRQCVSGTSKTCQQCNGQFSQIEPGDDPNICLPCVGYNSLIAARDQILTTAGFKIKGLPENREGEEEEEWLLISKKIENNTTVTNLTNQMKRFQHDYVYPGDVKIYTANDVLGYFENADFTDEPDDAKEEIMNLIQVLGQIQPDHLIICPSYDYRWDVAERAAGDPPTSFQKKIFGLINTYTPNGDNKSYCFMLCQYIPV